VLVVEPGRIVFRFHARDLHLVLGAPDTQDTGTGNGKPVRFRISLDGPHLEQIMVRTKMTRAMVLSWNIVSIN
jgi:hypothetical protein